MVLPLSGSGKTYARSTASRTGYASVKRFVRRLKRQRPEVADGMEHPPGQEAQVDFFQGPPTFDEGRGRWLDAPLGKRATHCRRLEIEPLRLIGNVNQRSVLDHSTSAAWI